jgi:hypothetical protein
MVETAPDANVPEVLLGRPFGEAGLRIVREELRDAGGACRAELARRLCRRLDWRTPGGTWSLMSARVALLRLHRQGWIGLPAARNGNGNAVALVPRPVAAGVGGSPGVARVDQLRGLHLQAVETGADSETYNALMAGHHYLGFTPMAGAQMRYLVGWEGGWLGAMGFGAAAWQLGPRDRFIGWNPKQRRRGLHRLVNNSRFLLLPWVRCANLASKVLAMGLRRLAEDFHARYGYRPVLVESFVEEGRFVGTSYRAANWVQVGWTQGRGKLGRRDQPRLARKAIWLYALDARFRRILAGNGCES